MSLSKIKKLLCAHRITRFTAEEVKDILQAPVLKLAEGAVEAATEHILLLLPQVLGPRTRVTIFS